MRKFVLFAAAFAVIAGAAVYAVACDKTGQKAAGAQVSSCVSGKAAATVLTGADGACPYHKIGATKTGATKTGAACEVSKKAACGAYKSTAAASGDCGTKDAACCADGKKCVNYVLAVADMQDERCVEKIEKALSGVKNVQAVYVDVDSHKAYVCTGQAKFDKKTAVKSVRAAGFKDVKYLGTDWDNCVHKMKAGQAGDAGKV